MSRSLALRSVLIACVAAVGLSGSGAIMASAQPPGIFAGRTLAPDGSPAEGVKITLSKAGDSNDRATTLTGPDGRFAIPALSSQGMTYISAESATLGGARLERYSPLAGITTEPIEIRMPGTIHVEGRVVDPDGDPVVGVRIGNAGRSGEGDFLMSGIGKEAIKRYRPPRPVAPPAGAAVPEPTPSPRPGSGVSGPDGRFSLGVFSLDAPVRPLALSVFPPRREPQHVMGIPQPMTPAEIAADASTPYYQAQRITRLVKPGGVLDLTIRLEPAKWIVFEGMVRDANGNPAAGAGVRVFAGRPPASWIDWIFGKMTDRVSTAAWNKWPIPVGYGMTGADGRYRIEALAETPESLEAEWGRKPGEAGYSVGAAIDPFRSALSPRFELAAGEAMRTVDISLPDGSANLSFEGRAVDPDGHPLAGLELIETSYGARATTGADGRFRLQYSMPAGNVERIAAFHYELGYRPLNLLPADDSWHIVYPDPEDRMHAYATFDQLRANGAFLVLKKNEGRALAQPAPAGGMPQPQWAGTLGGNLPIHLRVVDADGRPLAGYRVNGGDGYSGTTGPNGEADVTLPARSSPLLRVVAPDPGTDLWTIQPEIRDGRADAVTLVMRGEPSASGVVRFGGAPQSDVLMTLASENQNLQAETRTDAEGKFALDGIPPGPAYLSYRPRGLFVGPLPWRKVVVGPESRGLAIELPAPDLILHLPPFDPAGSDRQIRINNLDVKGPDYWPPDIGTVRDAAAVYGLIPGRYVIELFSNPPGGLASRLGPVAIKKGPAPVELTFPVSVEPK